MTGGPQLPTPPVTPGAGPVPPGGAAPPAPPALPAAPPPPPPGQAAFNDRVRLVATYINLIAVAMITLGVLTPAASVLNPIGAREFTPNLGLILSSIGIWSLSSLTLLGLAHWLLGRVQP